MDGHSWTVLGVGPAGLAAAGRLPDQGIAGGDLRAKWRAVPSNTHVGLVLDYLNAACPGYRITPLGSGEYRVGSSKFIELLDYARPLWLRYGT